MKNSLLLILFIPFSFLHGQHATSISASSKSAGMQQLLKRISKKSLLLNEYEFTEQQKESQWLGTAPATNTEIEAAERHLKTTLPDDYKEFLKISNGFHQAISTNPTIIPISKIDYLVNIDEDLVEIWKSHIELEETAKSLSQSIVIGGINEEQYFLLIPPHDKHKKWRYWVFASWIPGEHEYRDFKDYLNSTLTFLDKEAEGLTTPRPKPVIDYSLRDYVFDADWKNAYNKAFEFLKNRTNYFYFGDEVGLLKVLLLSASQLNNFEKLASDLSSLSFPSPQFDWLNTLVAKFREGAKDRISSIPDFISEQFIIKENPITFSQVQEQTKMYRPELLKEKNKSAKADYELYFLFAGGNADDFINLYESNEESLYFSSYLKAAVVYANLGMSKKSKIALRRYFETSFGYQPLEPFFNDALIKIMDKDFTREILEKLKLQK